MARQLPLVKIPGIGWRLRSKLPPTKEEESTSDLPTETSDLPTETSDLPTEIGNNSDVPEESNLEDSPKPEVAGKRNKKSNPPG